MPPRSDRGERLPLAGERPERPERADAARNRERVLAAARRLFGERGVERVTMEEVAREAGVGKGTVFHRFGDRAGLALALLDERERELQDALLGGDPPLGPGAPADQRLAAFLSALLEFTREHAQLLIAADGGKAGGRYLTGAYAAWHRHVAVLIEELAPGADSTVLAHLLLAPLAPDLVRHLDRELGLDADRVRRGIEGLWEGVGDG